MKSKIISHPYHIKRLLAEHDFRHDSTVFMENNFPKQGHFPNQEIPLINIQGNPKIHLSSIKTRKFFLVDRDSERS